MSSDLHQALQRLKDGTLTPADEQTLLRALKERRITIATGERAVALGGSADGAVIVTGDNNIVLVLDASRHRHLEHFLDRHRRAWLGDPAEVEQTYLTRLADQCERLFFPLGGLTHPLRLADIYQPLPLARTLASDCRSLPGAKRCGLDDLLGEAERGLLLAGNLGQGKSTSLQYLAWVHSRRPPDRLHHRQGDLLPFLLTASDLAQAWLPGRDPLQALALAAAGRRLLLPPDLVEAALRHALEHHAALVLVDAFDEYHAPEAQRAALLRDLVQFWQSAAPGNLLLIASRPFGLHNPGLFQYCFAPLEHPHRAGLLHALGRAILRSRSPHDRPPDERALQALQDAILNHPRLDAFDTPFYLTLMVLLACRETTPAGELDLAQGLALLGDLQRLTDLYLHFLRQTIHWERTKPTAPAGDVDERAALLALAESARLVPDPEPAAPWTLPLPPDQVESLQTFWQRAGLLHRDDLTGRLTFTHAAFYEFALALGLVIARKQGHESEVKRLRETFGASPAWDLRWRLFHGLMERPDVRFD